MMRYAIYMSRGLSGPCPIKNWFSKIIKESPPITLGRWNMEECSKKTNAKIDWANMDHCGPCGKYKIQEELRKTK